MKRALPFLSGRKPLLALLVLLTVLFTGPARATMVSMDFAGVDLPVFIKFVSELTGKNFIVDSKVRGKVTVLSPKMVSVEEAYKVFESVLQVYGYMAVPAGEVTKIMPARESAKEALPTMISRYGSRQGMGAMLTQVIPLQHVRSPAVLKMLAPMVSKNGLITAHGPSDTLIVTDTRGNIDRLLKVIRAIDVRESEAGVEVLTLEYAAAAKTADQIGRIMSAQNQGENKAGVTFGIVPDDRMNAMIVYGERVDLERVRAMVAELDRPAPRERGNIRVYKLKHADAEELAGVLTGLVGKAPAPGAAEGKAAQAVAVISEDVSIIPDASTNSLVITSGPEDFAELSQIILELDTAREQVLVEALIMEVSSDQSVQFGTQFNGGFSSDFGGDNAGLIGGFINPEQIPLSIFNPVAPGFGLGAASVPITINGVTFTNLDALITYGKSNSSFNIISTPQIMTLENKEATIVVAENRPFQTSENVGRNLDDTTINQFTYRDVGTTLRITPQINTGGVIKLDIFQEFSEIDEVATGSTGALLPVTRKRTTETTVLVRENQTVVLSGLIGKTTTNSVSKVPGLGDIPVLGWLFKIKSETERKTNLLIFISPKIVANPKDAEDIYITKVREFERIQYDETDRILPLTKPLAAVRPRRAGVSPDGIHGGN